MDKRIAELRRLERERDQLDQWFEVAQCCVERVGHNAGQLEREICRKTNEKNAAEICFDAVNTDGKKYKRAS